MKSMHVFKFKCIAYCAISIQSNQMKIVPFETVWMGLLFTSARKKQLSIYLREPIELRWQKSAQTTHRNIS